MWQWTLIIHQIYYKKHYLTLIILHVHYVIIYSVPTFKFFLNLYHSLGLFRWCKLVIFFFLIFPRKQDLTFHAYCLHCRQFARNVKPYFLGNIRKKTSICSLMKILPRVLSVKDLKKKKIEKNIAHCSFQSECCVCLYMSLIISFFLYHLAVLIWCGFCWPQNKLELPEGLWLFQQSGYHWNEDKTST